jgi:hypothetical protein
MKLPIVAVIVTLVSSPVLADTVTIRCPLIRQYSDSQVNFLLNHASSVIGEQEAGQIYSKYISLKTECSANGNASRVIPVSAKAKNWLTENGVDLYKMAGRT